MCLNLRRPVSSVQLKQPFWCVEFTWVCQWHPPLRKNSLDMLLGPKYTLKKKKVGCWPSKPIRGLLKSSDIQDRCYTPLAVCLLKTDYNNTWSAGEFQSQPSRGWWRVNRNISRLSLKGLYKVATASSLWIEFFVGTTTTWHFHLAWNHLTFSCFEDPCSWILNALLFFFF